MQAEGGKGRSNGRVTTVDEGTRRGAQRRAEEADRGDGGGQSPGGRRFIPGEEFGSG